MDEVNLSTGLEDYIEAIYIAELNKTQLKGAGLARNLNISRASVSEALARLVERKLIEYKSYGVITLTTLGKKEAEKVYAKHNALKNFFEVVLSIPPEEAEENGCKIEHIISQTILDRMIKLTDYCKKHPKLIAEFNIND